MLIVLYLTLLKFKLIFIKLNALAGKFAIFRLAPWHFLARAGMGLNTTARNAAQGWVGVGALEKPWATDPGENAVAWVAA
ncbi:MAG: hypothetical protein WCK81_10800 [Betaproteobacteria bacterium]